MTAPRVVVAMGEAMPAGPVSDETRKVLAQFRENCGGSLDEWTLVEEKKKACRVWSKKVESSAAVQIRVDLSPAFAHVPAQAVWEVLTEEAHFKEWDTSSKEYRLRDKIEEDATTGVWLSYYRVNMPVPLTDRDWALLRTVYVSSDRREMIVVSRSTEHPTMPPVTVGHSKPVRAHCFCSGFRVIAQPGEEGCQVQYFAHNDFKGKIPHKLVNWAFKTLASSIVGKLYRASARVAPPRQGLEQHCAQETAEIDEPPPTIGADEIDEAAETAGRGTPRSPSAPVTPRSPAPAASPRSPAVHTPPPSMSMMM